MREHGEHCGISYLMQILVPERPRPTFVRTIFRQEQQRGPGQLHDARREGLFHVAGRSRTRAGPGAGSNPNDDGMHVTLSRVDDADCKVEGGDAERMIL